ncbi:unnamed protein product [Cuscuta campestris]|uniref:Protein phosphatase n=1 Tax=Cuscuta campestris TaxID=132261 RepID=A0A484KRC3_9ASTE|nr:unnamed protein product [Cuscuta campestris]
MPFKDLLTVHSANWHEVQRLISGRKSALQELVKLSVSQGRLLLGHSKLFHSLCAAQENLYTVNQAKNISVARSFSRAIYIPSVPGPAFHVYDYLGCLISYPTHLSSGIESQRTPMAACGFRSSSLFECPSIAKRRGNAFPLEGFVLNSFHRLPHACFSSGTAPDLSLDKVSADQFANSADSKEEKVWIGRSLKLNSGSCYLPHPDKEETGGEDAHFICGDEQAIGVADGVGGWAELGVDAGQYARELMSNSVSAVLEEPKGSIDPARVLEKAHMSTKAKGSSTACIIALTDQGLHAINLGDSGFMVVRDGCTVFRSPSQQHDFNFTFQLESGSAGDLPSSGQVFKVGVAPGDVIITGTDGLFDNLYNSDITAVVVHGARAGLGPQVIAQQIAALARQRARDKYRQTPFSSAALDAGFLYYGGKLDDITVVVSYVTTTTRDESESSSAPPCKST